MLSRPNEKHDDCSAGEFRCPNNGICLPNEFKCNGVNDCNPLDDWDEGDCPGLTYPNGCNSTQVCIPSTYVCDRDDDCDDGSDEQNCDRVGQQPLTFEASPKF